MRAIERASLSAANSSRRRAVYEAAVALARVRHKQATHPEWAEPTACAICGGKALTMWRDKGYCRQHRAEASAAAARDARPVAYARHSGRHA